jgi:hypothetical protein
MMNGEVFTVKDLFHPVHHFTVTRSPSTWSAPLMPRRMSFGKICILIGSVAIRSS